MKNRSHKNDIKYKKHLGMMMLICIKQHLNNICSSIHEKFKQRWDWLEKKALVIKNACISLVPILKAYLNYFLFRREFEIVFTWIAWIGFPRPHFVDSEIVIWGLTSLTDFYKRGHLLFKKTTSVSCQKKISFVRITHLKSTFLTPCNIKSYYQ